MLFQRTNRHGRDGVAGDDDLAHLELLQERDRLAGEAPHGRVRLGAVGDAGRVAEVNDRPAGEQPAEVAHDGKSADSRVENAQRAAVAGARSDDAHRHSETASGASTS